MTIEINILLILVLVIAALRVAHGCAVGMTEEIASLGNILVLSVMLIILLQLYKGFRTDNKIQALICGILFLILSIAYKLIKVFVSPVKMIVRLPIMKNIDKVCGGLFGIVETLALLWALEAMVTNLGLGGFGRWFQQSVDNSKILMLLVDKNYIWTWLEMLEEWILLMTGKGIIV